MFSNFDAPTSDKSGGGGGGFMSSSQTPSGTQDGKTARRLDTVTPMTIEAIHKYYKIDENFMYFGNPVSFVSLVGIVKTVDVQSTNISYHLDDMTSDKDIMVRQWLTDPEDTELGKPLMENTYAKVVGHIRSTKGEIFVFSRGITPVTDLNELTMHMLEVIQAKKSLCERNKAVINLATDKMKISGNEVIIAGANSRVSANISKVLTVIRASSEEIGCTAEFIKAETKLSAKDVEEAMNMLQEEGHIFQTIDNAHFAVSS